LHNRCTVLHRVDGPLAAYRGADDGTDRRIAEINGAVADVTVFQSRYSVLANAELGFTFAAPVVIPNAVDARIFYRSAEKRSLTGRKIRLISTSWSDNPNKGAATYRHLEQALDWDRFEYTFVGRSPIMFDRINMIPAVGSDELAELLREHDVYVTASVNDPCSNALLEALACGLPALYLESGGHAELVADGGLPFSSADQLAHQLDRLVDEYDYRHAAISVPRLDEIADRYLEAMGLREV
jgi:glycosyltransferase involved in cell wall biosynthesis